MMAKVQRLLPQHTFLQSIPAIAAVLLTFLLCVESSALDARKYAIEISVEVQTAPFALKLTWTPSDIARTYTIRRRVFGSAEWGGVRASLPGSARGYSDSAVSEGTAYEYEVQLETTARGEGGWVNAFGYVLAGSKVMWPDLKGKVLLIVEATVAASLSPEIEDFQRKLLGAGWLPIRHDLPRACTVPEVRNIIRAEYNADPSKVRAVILLGHVPVPYSGNIAPDLHPSHRGAWPADVYYADVDGDWTDTTVDIISGDYRANDNWPGDGKFDQSQIPSTVELELGRIDFYDLPAFNGKTQIDLLRTYLRKNSDFRHRQFTMNRRMLVRDNFGDLSGDAPAVDAWRHYRQMFGPGSVREVGIDGFFPTLQDESFLWAYGGGGGGNTKADGVGTTTDFAQLNPRAVFLVLHGSYFGDWNTKDNFLRAAIGGPNYTLAGIWSGLPHWFMHTMGLGRSVGSVTRLTQNNMNNYKSHLNFSAQQVHIALIGDPTLENFPVIPPSNLSGSASGNVNLSWSPSSDENVTGYYVYHSNSSLGPYQRLTPEPSAPTSYSHSIGNGTHHYMVRAVKLERTGSGTYYSLSQGVFVSVVKPSSGTVPVVRAISPDADAGETGPDSGLIRVERSVADENPLTVEVLTGGTAQNGVDYATIGNAVVIPAGSSHVDVTINPIADNLIEEDEPMTLLIRTNPSYTVGSPSSGGVTISDAVNLPPSATGATVETVENSPCSILLAAQDPEGQALTYFIKVAPANGTLSGSAPSIVYTPKTNYFGADSFVFSVSDGKTESDNASVSIIVKPRNKPPAAIPVSVVGLEDQPFEIAVSGIDPENDPLQTHILLYPTNGILSKVANGVYMYHPRTNFNGTDRLTFQVRDAEFLSDPATVGITIVGTNDPPVAFGEALEAMEDQNAFVILTGWDVDGDPLEYHLVDGPTHGVIAGESWNLVYLPSTNYFGHDALSFVVSDGSATSSVATVVFTITATNDAPTAKALSLVIQEDQVFKIRLEGEDAENDDVSLEIETMPLHGTISGTPPDVTYTPHMDFHGVDTFTYVANDGFSNSLPAIVTIEVEPVNDPPSIGDIANRTQIKNSFVGPVVLGLADIDDGIGVLTLWAESSNPALIPTNRINFISGDTNRQMTLFPNKNAAGEAEITVHLSDGEFTIKTSFLLSITNAPPVVLNDHMVLPVGTNIIPVSTILANDHDADLDFLRVVSVSRSVLGNDVQLATNETVVYFGGTNAVQDSFAYEVEDESQVRRTGIVFLKLFSGSRISAVLVQAGNVRLIITGLPNRVFNILMCTDGVNWSVVGQGTSDEDGRGEFIDSGGANSHHRLYRVEWPAD